MAHRFDPRGWIGPSDDTEDESNDFQRLIEETSELEARKKRNKASQNHQQYRDQAETHQQNVYKLIKQGSKLPPSDRIPLALEAKIEQFNAVFARLRAFKGLKNQLVWRYLEVMKDFQGREFENDEVNVPLEELDGELGQLSNDMQDMAMTIQSELQEALDVMQSFEFQDGAFQVQAGDILQQMEEFDEETTSPEDFASLNMEVGNGGLTAQVGTNGVEDVDAGDVEDDIDMDGGMGLNEALNQMGAMADGMSDSTNSQG